MIYSARELERFQIAARDGLLGTVRDIYFDEQSWLSRYFALAAGPWLDRRLILLSAARVRLSDSMSRALSIDATQQQVRASPAADIEQPLTRAQELAMHDHYGWPYYWSLAGTTAGLGSLNAGTTNAAASDTPPSPAQNPAPDHTVDPSLHSVHEIRGYSIAALDAALGEVDDVLLDHARWEIRYLVVDTRKWLPGPKVLISPQAITQFRPATLEVAVNLTREQIKRGPPYDSAKRHDNIYTDRRPNSDRPPSP